jgi:hypothetical protein
MLERKIFIALPKFCAGHLGVNITDSYSSCASGSAADPYVFGPPESGSGSIVRGMDLDPSINMQK